MPVCHSVLGTSICSLLSRFGFTLPSTSRFHFNTAGAKMGKKLFVRINKKGQKHYLRYSVFVFLPKQLNSRAGELMEFACCVAKVKCNNNLSPAV